VLLVVDLRVALRVEQDPGRNLFFLAPLFLIALLAGSIGVRRDLVWPPSGGARARRATRGDPFERFIETG
jgi:hypothetical protein